MSTLTTPPLIAVAGAAAARRTAAPPIPFRRLVGVELVKMFDTRAGFWLMASIVITASLATGAVILWAPDAELTYATFATALGFPMAVILPIVAILSVTSEWTQRSGLSTFTMVPHRGRVIAAKAIGTLVVGVVSMALAFAVGAVGNLVGPALAGSEVTWDVSLADTGYIVLGNVLGMMVGFMLGVLLRNSPAAIVAYFVYSLVLPTLAGLLAAFQEWFADLQPWVDFQYAQTSLYEGGLTGEQWAQLSTSGALWLVAPLALGLVLLLRSEVK